MKRVTMKDIAARAGVAQQSVSEVMNDYPRSRIRPETRARIMTAARELGYRPNYLASSLKKGRTDAVGFIGAGAGEASRFTVPNMQAAAGIEDSLPEEKTLIMLSGRGTAGMEKSLNLVKRGIVDGLIIKAYPFHYPYLVETVIPQLDLTGIPYVVIHPTARQLPCVHVGIDREYGSYLAAKSFIEHGITDIGLTLPGPWQSERMEVVNGVKRALEESGRMLPEHRILCGAGHTPGEEWEPRKVPLLATVEDLPRGLVLYNSGAAENAVEVLAARGRSVPEDVALAGLGPVIDPEEMNPGLLITGVPIETQSTAATELLLEMLDGPEDADRPVRILRPQVLHVPAQWERPRP